MQPSEIYMHFQYCNIFNEILIFEMSHFVQFILSTLDWIGFHLTPQYSPMTVEHLYVNASQFYHKKKIVNWICI